MLQWIRQETPGHQSIEVTAKQDIPDTFGSGIDGPFVLGKVTYRDTPAILAANGRRPSRLILEECMNRLGCQRSMNTTKGRSWDTWATVGAALCRIAQRESSASTRAQPLAPVHKRLERESAGEAHPDARLFFFASRKTFPPARRIDRMKTTKTAPSPPGAVLCTDLATPTFRHALVGQHA